MGGFGDGVLDALNRAGVRVPLLKIALAEGFVHHGAVEDLRAPAADRRAGHPGQVREALGAAGGRQPRRTPGAARRASAPPRRGGWPGSASTSCWWTGRLPAAAPQAQALLMAGGVELAGSGNRTLKPGQLVAADVELPSSPTTLGVPRRREAGGGARRVRVDPLALPAWMPAPAPAASRSPARARRADRLCRRRGARSADRRRRADATRVAADDSARTSACSMPPERDRAGNAGPVLHHRCGSCLRAAAL